MLEQRAQEPGDARQAATTRAFRAISIAAEAETSAAAPGIPAARGRPESPLDTGAEVAKLLSGKVEAMPFVALDSTTRDLQLLEEEFVRCIRRRDPERLVETFYAPDAELQVPGHPVVNGREAILAWLRREFENGLIELKREANHFEAEHSLACASGRYSLTRETQPGILCTKEGCFTSVFRRQPDGHWRVIIDCLTLVR